MAENVDFLSLLAFLLNSSFVFFFNVPLTINTGQLPTKIIAIVAMLGVKLVPVIQKIVKLAVMLSLSKHLYRDTNPIDTTKR